MVPDGPGGFTIPSLLVVVPVVPDGCDGWPSSLLVEVPPWAVVEVGGRLELSLEELVEESLSDVVELSSSWEFVVAVSPSVVVDGAVSDTKTDAAVALFSTPQRLTPFSM